MDIERERVSFERFIKDNNLGFSTEESYQKAWKIWSARAKESELQELKFAEMYLSLTDAAGYNSIGNLSPEEWISDLVNRESSIVHALEEELMLAHLKPLKSYSSAKEAISDLINWHVETSRDPRVNGGYILVPLIPTEEMLYKVMNTGLYHDCEEMAKGVLTDEYRTMLAAAPKQFETPMKNYHYQPIATGEKEAPFEIPEPPKSKEPTDSEMWDWLIKENCSVFKLPFRPFIYEYKVFDSHGDVISVGETAREAITKAMCGTGERLSKGN